ncbi:LIM and calponin homology domains-containing protein 1-like isoform X11 [Pseudoliparis swirei]|uniref:LIM and calponin homology domains-containing protein 1-like isoform X11 n=1 Tax=Pseudoliparis swirei TaxID=2059687 RepID=UPI0024BEF699|nr:LIM and calponin homology domains-containing protein 1-like isoform X11 [Pseudoliparis swirei]
MASPAPGRDVPNASPRDEPGPNHPEPACLEAQKWIEAVTGKSFGDKDFRSGLENGILLCELLSAIKPGLVKKINRLPTPIAGLDNLSVFLRGCEEFGLKGSQLFDPGDLQDTSTRANLKDCNRKIKNVLNTVFWLGKAAGGCASYSGPTLNLKEFEGLLAQMKVESEDSSQMRSVRDSGYDCWDSERSDSLSPPRHTRDDSLDSLDSFGSRSQHSPSPDVANRGNGDGRGSDSEADAPSRRPDVRKDDMLARRTASSESRVSIPFNQFLPNRTNNSSYIPTPRRKPHTEEGEQRSQVDGADLNQTTPPSAVLPLCSPESPSPPAEMDTRLAHYERRTDGGEEEDDDDEEEDKIPDPQKDDMMARRTGVFHKQSTAPVTYNRFLPLPSTKRCTQGEVATDAAPRNKRDVQAARSKELNARSFSHSVRAEQHPPRVPMETPQLHPDTTAIRATSHSQFEYEDDDGDEYDENEPEPDLEKDDMMARRTRSFQKTDAARTNKPINRFLPVPGSVKYNVAPVSAMKPLRNRLKLTEKLATESVVAMVAEPQALLSKAPTLPKCAGPRERQAEGGKQEGGVATPQSSVTGVTEPLSSPSLTPPPLRPAAARACKVEAELGNQGVEERVEETVEEREKDVNREPRRKPFWLDDDDLPPIMMSRRVAFMSEDTESVSMSDILNEEEVEHLPPLSQSRYERRHEQSNNFQDDDDHWQSELARWKNRRRSTSQELIKKEEERKRMEKRMKEEGSGSNKRKSIKTYKEILEEKERRESELCDAYRNAATPEEASVVLQRYALRFTISDATLDSLKLPRYPANPKQDLHPADREHKTTSPTNESSQPPNKLEPPVIKDQSHAEPGEMKTDVTAQQETSVSSSSPAAGGPLGPVTNSENVPPQSLEVNEPRSKPTPTTRPKQPIAGDAKPQPKHSEAAHVPPHSTRPGHALPSPPSVAPRPVPLLAAKPYCQPRSAQSGHKPVKMDGLVRVNGEVKVDLSVSTSPTSACHSPPEVKDNPSKMMEKDVPSEKTGKDVPSEKTMKDVPSEKTVKNVPLEQTEKDVPPEQISAYQETVEETPSPQTERSSSSLGSAISSLIGGRNCIITTTIVTELTHVEPHQPDSQSNAQVNGTSGFSESPVEGKKAPPASPPNRMQESSPTVTEGLEESSVTIETPMLNLAKRVNHWVWDPNEERKRLESWQQEQERLLQEQYQREQEKLKKEWEKAQLEVQEEGRKHNEEERRILEETVQPLNQTGFVNQQSGQMGTTSSAPEHNQTERGNVAPQQNGQSTSTGNEGQHVSKLHFLQDSACDGEPLMKQELWKTASLDRNPQLNQAHIAQRSESHGAVTNKQQPSALSPQPPSHSRSVSGKRLCSGCSQPLEKGAAMIIDTLGLFFHIQCFKCGACKGQLGDATAGTDVRIRNGLLSCHECYIASRGRGQPTTL